MIMAAVLIVVGVGVYYINASNIKTPQHIIWAYGICVKRTA